MKKLLLICITIGVCVNAYSDSRETNICLTSKIQTRSYISVSNIDNYDWKGNDRPDKNFTNLYIDPGQTICRHEEINSRANSIGFDFIIDGRTSHVHTIPSAISSYGYRLKVDSTTDHGLIGNNRVFSSYEQADKCTDTTLKNCSTFYVIDPDLPKGSYFYSCKNIGLDFNGRIIPKLTAYCLDDTAHPDWHFSLIYYKDCPSTISNISGNLKCDSVDE